MNSAEPVESGLPRVVVSLDFELRWGMHDELGLDMDAYRQPLEDERQVVPSLLALLSERGLRATWATVGAIACRDWNEYFRRARPPPPYRDPRNAIRPRYSELDPNGMLHFAPDLVEAIHRAPGQELGTHTFSHLFMREPGVRATDVAADLAAVGDLWTERFSGPPTSLVFPRNQIAHLDAVRASAIRIWRGNERPWFYDRNETSTNGLLPRAARLVDALNPWVRRAAPLEDGMTRSSLYLRLSLPRSAWRLHVARVRRELAALRAGEVSHLWWHPHNLGGAIPERLSRVVEVLDLLADRVRSGTLSATMRDLVEATAA